MVTVGDFQCGSFSEIQTKESGLARFGTVLIVLLLTMYKFSRIFLYRFPENFRILTKFFQVFREFSRSFWIIPRIFHVFLELSKFFESFLDFPINIPGFY